MSRDLRFVMDLTGDTVETILKEHEVYSNSEMNRLLEENSIICHTMIMGDQDQRKKNLLEEISMIDEQLTERNGVVN